MIGVIRYLLVAEAISLLVLKGGVLNRNCGLRPHAVDVWVSHITTAVVFLERHRTKLWLILTVLEFLTIFQTFIRIA
jgi:hypothetical protein